MSSASQANGSGQTENNAPAAAAANPVGHLNAAQITGIQNQMIAEFRRTVDDVEMRKLAIEQAVKALEGQRSPAMVMDLAKEIHAFMSAPAAQIVVKII